MTAARWRFRRHTTRHPEWWVVPLAATAWLLLGVAEAGTAAGWSAHHGGGGAGVGRAAVMAVAMMAPMTLPTVRHVGLSSLRPRRFRAGALFLAGYLAVWTAAAAAIAAAVAAVAGTAGRLVALALAFGGAAAWQFAGAKRRALRRCARTVPLAPRGWRADRDCGRFGVTAAGPCVVTCWGFMAAAAAGGHGVAVMAPLFAVQLRERMAVRYAPAAGAALVAALGAVLAAAALAAP